MQNKLSNNNAMNNNVKLNNNAMNNSVKLNNNAMNNNNVKVNNNNAMNNNNVKVNNNNAMNNNNVKVNNNVKKPVETFSALSLCSKILWGIPVVVGIVQIIMWLIKLYKTHILKEKSDEEYLTDKLHEIHVLILKNKQLNSENAKLTTENKKLKEAPLPPKKKY